ncbi:MAG TPA: sn-glycerol-1-phosphate dehydrogenase [Halanaerobiales bacterium]|nr:sn-glycerol-1-phosphate dehydrogenase [Halanaerobiales bacterium]
MIEDLLNSSFTCSCGKEHHINIKEIIVGRDILNNIPKTLPALTDKKKVLLVSDNNTYQAAGEKASRILKEAGFKVNNLILTGNQVKPNPTNLFKIIREYTEDQYIIACGSGSINDLTGYASYKMGEPYSVLATAPSMDGYASSVASITAEGVKQTYNTAPAEAIFADIEVLRKAPLDLILAGYGDLLGKTTSLLDWKLADILFNEYYCEKAVSIVKNELKNIIQLLKKGNIRAAENIETLIKGLIYSGIAMLMVDSSRPASGSEHHISHYLEMFGEKENIDLPYHGIKVGIGTLFTTSFYLKLKKLDFSKLEIRLNKDKREEEIKKIYGDRAQPILDNLYERWNKESITKDEIKNKEYDIKNLIDHNIEIIKKARKILTENNFLQADKTENISKKLLKNAIRYGFEIRTRYTVTTFLNQVEKLDEFVDALLEYYH